MAHNPRDSVAVGPAERLLTTILMAVVALAANSVRPSHEEVCSSIERSHDPYFRAFLDRCMARVTKGRD